MFGIPIALVSTVGINIPSCLTPEQEQSIMDVLTYLRGTLGE